MKTVMEKNVVGTYYEKELPKNKVKKVIKKKVIKFVKMERLW